jgi:hypothetical protein
VEGQAIRKDSSFVLQPQDVVLESFADETVAVHLGTGRYFSIDAIGAEIVELLQTGNDVGAVVECLVTRHAADAAEVDDAVIEFVGRLVDEGLVRPAPDGHPSTLISEEGGAGGPFTRPSITVYSDMEDLLLLDPIHDVDATGWPVRAENVEGDPGAPADTE